jgi:hypothetical protein
MRLIMGSAIVIVLLAGCSGNTPGPGPGPGPGGTVTATPTGESTPDPCTLVTKDAVAAAVGGTVGDGTSDLITDPLLGEGRECTFRTADDRGILSLTVWPATRDEFALDREQAKGFGGAKEMTGLGDAAFTVGYNELHVLTGAYVVKLGLQQVKYDPDTSLKGLTTLARSCVEQL